MASRTVNAMVAPSYAKPRCSAVTRLSRRSTSHWSRASIPHSNPQITACGIASSERVTSAGATGKPRRANVTDANDGVSTSLRNDPRVVGIVPSLFDHQQIHFHRAAPAWASSGVRWTPTHIRARARLTPMALRRDPGDEYLAAVGGDDDCRSGGLVVGPASGQVRNAGAGLRRHRP